MFGRAAYRPDQAESLECGALAGKRQRRSNCDRSVLLSCATCFRRYPRTHRAGSTDERSIDPIARYAILGDTMHEQDLAIVKGLVSVAWADGRVAAEELEVIDALLDAFNASPSDKVEVREYAQTPRSIDDVPLTELSYDDRRVLLQHAVLLTYIDGEQHEKEKELLDQLCSRLRIPQAEAIGIIQMAEERAKGFLKLL